MFRILIALWILKSANAGGITQSSGDAFCNAGALYTVIDRRVAVPLRSYGVCRDTRDQPPVASWSSDSPDFAIVVDTSVETVISSSEFAYSAVGQSNVPGRYQLSWTIECSNGHTATCVREVIVQEESSEVVANCDVLLAYDEFDLFISNFRNLGTARAFCSDGQAPVSTTWTSSGSGLSVTDPSALLQSLRGTSLGIYDLDLTVSCLQRYVDGEVSQTCRTKVFVYEAGIALPSQAVCVLANPYPPTLDAGRSVRFVGGGLCTSFSLAPTLTWSSSSASFNLGSPADFIGRPERGQIVQGSALNGQETSTTVALVTRCFNVAPDICPVNLNMVIAPTPSPTAEPTVAPSLFLPKTNMPTPYATVLNTPAPSASQSESPNNPTETMPTPSSSPRVITDPLLLWLLFLVNIM